MKFIMYFILFFPVWVISWEEDPRIEKHNLLTRELLALGDFQAGLKPDDENFIEWKCQKEVKKMLENTPNISEKNEKISTH